MKKNIKYGAILEARMGSTRLPGKSLFDLNGEPLIKRVIDRIKSSNRLDQIVLATTDNSIDDILVHYAEEINIDVFRGSEENVLERVVLAAEEYSIKYIVELHGDNPFLDPEIIDNAIEMFEIKKCDYISNTIKKTFPMGLRVQVFPTNLLREIYDTIDDPAVNEHVSLYFYENPDMYKLENLTAPSEINRPEIRLTVDTKEDFQFASNIYRKILEDNLFPNFKTIDVLNIIDKHHIPRINKSIESKPVR